MSELLSVWLLPAAHDRLSLAAEIERIARRLGSPRFSPHITLLGDMTAARGSVEPVLRHVTAGLAPLSLQPHAVTTSARRFQALTLRLTPTAELQRLTQILTTRLGVGPAHVPEPHLSLAYPREPFDPALLASLAAEDSLMHSLRFDALALVDPGPGNRDWGEVDAWRVSSIPFAP